jgi:anti-sigma factor ChrR (cupin superfamily)
LFAVAERAAQSAGVRVVFIRRYQEIKMKRVLLSAAVAMMAIAALTSTMTSARQDKKKIVGVTPEQVRWFTPPYYKDGRRAQIYGDSSHGGPWVDQVKIPAGLRVPAHMHPNDELVTVIEGTWYLGEGERFEPTKLTGYPAGSFIVIPAGVAHFVATKESAVVVQLSGTDKFVTEYLEN